ncbi:hypothetical protein [Microbulbifer spongiae]|uniref:DUF8051 domain-containing protein n=1 Tax=Microbulbifer spongiae TaxID=2944933 RepID=A0ABY9EB09_9GAMM|nr:hypothetical protein [Microbulbifer sp. MI-G]WKD50168.1 hypothetical protein M8T91_01690 [Microbulbifer sp. MI-G]
MENFIGYAISGLLVLSAVLLGLLIPGGPIENRNFSHIAPAILGMFNTFLTVLGIASLSLAYFSIGAGNLALIASAICGISYFLVYALDLAKIFPVSPDKMPITLFIIEVAGLILAIPLTLLSLYYLSLPRSGISEMDISSSTINSILVVLLIIGIGIIAFATKAAMRK